MRARSGLAPFASGGGGGSAAEAGRLGAGRPRGSLVGTRPFTVASQRAAPRSSSSVAERDGGGGGRCAGSRSGRACARGGGAGTVGACTRDLARGPARPLGGRECAWGAAAVSLLPRPTLLLLLLFFPQLSHLPAPSLPPSRSFPAPGAVPCRAAGGAPPSPGAASSP